MKALVYHGPGQKQFENVPNPALREATDAIVRVTKTTSCGTDLHLLKGELVGGRIANIGVHGTSVTLRLEKLWSQNITITTRLKPTPLITHHCKLGEIIKAYDTFAHAGREHALKVILTNDAGSNG